MAGSAGPDRGPKILGRVRLLLTLLTFAVIAWYFHHRPHLEAEAFRLRWGFLPLAALCTLPAVGLRALKWKLLARGAAPGIGYRQALRSYAGALSLGLITPGRLGELSRGWYLPQPAMRGWRGAGLVVIDNWLDLLGVLAWACLGWVLRFGTLGLALGGGAAALFAPVRPWLRLAGGVAHRLPRLKGAREAAERALAAGEDVAGRDWRGAWLAGTAAFACDWLQAALLMSFLAPEPPALWRLAGIMALVTLANSFQVTLAGLGVREGLAMLLLADEGVGPEVAVAAAFLQTCLGQFLPALAGLAVRPPEPDPEEPVAAAPADSRQL